MVSCGEVMVIESVADLVSTGLLLSLTDAVKVNVPAAVGVPEMVPLLADKANPVGRVPEEIDQV